MGVVSLNESSTVMQRPRIFESKNYLTAKALYKQALLVI